MTTAFGIEKENLAELLNGAHEGKTQLPEFQRGWVWDDGHVRSLLASISLSYPIGAVMMLAGGGGQVRFKERAIEGASVPPDRHAERLILDGQQRLTSLYQSLLLDRPTLTRDARGKAIERWYYIDINKALDPETDREEAITSVPSDRVVRDFRGQVLVDYATPEREFEAMAFPLARVFTSSSWRMGFEKHWGYARDRIELWNQFEASVVERFKLYHIPVIELSRDTPKEAVCQVFEKVNTGGVTLTVFELLTATFAADDYDLREDWDKRSRVIKARSGVLRDFSSTDFLQIVTLLTTYDRSRNAQRAGVAPDRLPAVSAKRADMLKLQKSDYEGRADDIVSALDEAVRFLHSQRVFDSKFLPYGGQLVPLTALMRVIGSRAQDVRVREKIARWYWCGVFGELYGGATESRFARDLPDLVAWLDGGDEPRTVKEADFSPGRLLTLRTRGSAAYKGVYVLLLREGALDFRTGEASDVHNYHDEAVDIHHVFPQHWCQVNGIQAMQCDSIVNKTPLSARTNRSIGGHAPSVYLKTLEAKESLAASALDGHASTHLIDPVNLREDDFTGSYAARSRALLGAIALAMGKPITPDVGPEEPPDAGDYEVLPEDES